MRRRGGGVGGGGRGRGGGGSGGAMWGHPVLTASAATSQDETTLARCGSLAGGDSHRGTPVPRLEAPSGTV
eukprot:5641939-Pyramimonas_sp.AAC.1